MYLTYTIKVTHNIMKWCKCFSEEYTSLVFARVFALVICGDHL